MDENERVAEGDSVKKNPGTGSHVRRTSEKDLHWADDLDQEEPELEFDDEYDLEAYDLTADNELDKEEPVLLQSAEGAVIKGDQSKKGGGAIRSDGIIDEDFAEALGVPSEVRESDMPFYDIAQHRIIEIAGDDSFGRKVIVFSACRLPPTHQLDHARLLQYLKHTLDQYVENDYSLVYFHYGLNSKNKPSFSWLRQAYREFDRKYKKNLKALYLIHPTNFIRILWNIFKPIISAKFGRKVMYVNYLHEVRTHLHMEQLPIPERVRENDTRLLEKYKPKPRTSSTSTESPEPVDTQQFGVTLKFIKDHNYEVIPPVLHQSVTYLEQYGLEVEGLFRRSANLLTVKNVKKSFNDGKPINFSQLVDIHIPAVIVKAFLRELPEPLMTFELYEKILQLHSMDLESRVLGIQHMLLSELPEDNYTVLKYVITFLTKVAEKSDINKMNSTNLAIVFGPNLIWSRSQASLASMSQINSFTRILIDEYDDLFIK